MPDHVHFDLGAKPPVVRCVVCKGERPLVLPMKLSDATATMERFTNLHRNCEKKEQPQ